MMMSEDKNKDETNQEDDQLKDKKEHMKNRKNVDHSVSSQTSQINSMKLSNFYDYQDNAMRLILYLGRLIFFFLIISIIGVFYYSLQTVDKIKQYYSIQLQPMAFSEDIMLIQKEVNQLFLIN